MIQLAYSVWLKRMAGFDVVVISLLFTLRASSGYTFEALPVSPYFLITIFCTAMMLALAKRLSEKINPEAVGTRKSLDEYSIEQLKTSFGVFAAGIIFSYLNWIQISSEEINQVFALMSLLPVSILQIRLTGKLLSPEGENPERILFKSHRDALILLVWVVLYYKAKGFI